MNYLIIFLALVFSAFFSGMEIAFVSANKLKIILDKKKGQRLAGIIARFLKKPSSFIATMLVGNNISLVVYGIIMAKILEPYIAKFTTNEFVIFSSQTVISTVLILFTAEFLPKTIFRIDPNKILYILAVPLIIFYYTLWLPTVFITGIAEFILSKLLGIKINFSENKIVFDRIDLDNYVSELESENEIENEIKIFQNALDFSTVKVRECMVPRTEITAVEINCPIEKLMQKFTETHLSKIIIYRENMDNAIGYAHAYEMFKKPQTIQSVLLPISVFPQSMPASEALKNFIKEKKSIAVVVDEFGGTSGLLTIEDVVEEIFGEIEDEHDSEQITEKRISENEFEFSARLEIDYLNDKFSLGLPKSDEYETLAGLILFITEDIPQENEKIEFENWTFRIKKVTSRRIELIRLTAKTV